MYRKIEELTEEEINELKASYYWSDDNKEYDYPEDVPTSVVYERFGEISFTDEDFFCNMDSE